MVASGKKLTSPGKCTQVHLKLQKIPFAADFYALPFEGYVVVLGTQWLRVLGKMQWDFKKLLTKVLWDNRVVVLQGIKKSCSILTKEIHVRKLTKKQQGIVLQALDSTNTITKQEHIPSSFQDLL